MKLALSPQDAAFRDEVHAYIAENYPAQMRVPNPETDLTKKQMLQHGMADMFIAHQEALCLMQHLNLSLSAGEAGISRLASGAKSKIDYAGKFVVDQAVQLYGGMGMTDEPNVGHDFKRISSINIQFGDPAYHVLHYPQLNAAA